MTWSAIAIRSYYGALAVCGALIIYFVRPHLDLSVATIITVVIVGVFLLFAEHPTKAAGVTAAPLTAIISATTVLFGWWSLVLSAIAWGSIHWRVRTAQEGFFRPFLAWLGQVGQSCIGIYFSLSIWAVTQQITLHRPSAVTMFITMMSIIVIGMVYQTTNNIASSITYLLAGQPLAPARFASIGLIAAVYGYLLVAIYHFSGIIGTAIFYVFVGQERMVQGVLGLTAQVQQLYHARTQARMLVSDLMRFADADQGRFAEEVQLLSQQLATKLGLARDEVAKIGLAAELHEIGKARLPARMRASVASAANGNGYGSGDRASQTGKSGSGENGLADLSPQELAQLRTYPRAGALMVRQADALLPGEIAFWIECHDEHYDGSGFPRGLRADEIPLQSRIIAIAREFVRLTIGANGNYEAQKDTALATIRERSGTFYDPSLVQLLEETVTTRAT